LAAAQDHHGDRDGALASKTSRAALGVVAAGAVFLACGCGSQPRPTPTPSAKPGTISTAGCTPGRTAAKYPDLAGKTLKIAASPLAPPFIFQKRQRIVGFDADFVEAWTKCLGLEYTWQVYQDVSAMIAAVQAGRADLVHSELYVNPTRAKQVDFVVYMKSLTGSAVRKGNPKKIESLDDLCGKADAQGVGTLEIPLLKRVSKKCQAAGKPPVHLIVYRGNDQSIQALVSGRTDAFLSDKVYVESIAKQFPSKVETSFTIDNHLIIGVGINKHETELRQAILGAVKAIQRNGTEKRLLRKWNLDVKQEVPAYQAR
jgi:polar amino acid transport system substrate-binding protein